MRSYAPSGKHDLVHLSTGKRVYGFNYIPYSVVSTKKENEEEMEQRFNTCRLKMYQQITRLPKSGKDVTRD